MLLLLGWASLTSSCAMCGACGDAIIVNVTLGAGPGPVTASGLTCTEYEPTRWSCSRFELPEGENSIEVRAPGHDPQLLTFTVGPPSGGDLYCSDCPGSYYGSVTF